jgi:hypothetical protein
VADCIRGCTWQDGDESGPSEATRGQLCEWCFLRLRDHLSWAPNVTSTLRSEVIPALQAVDFEAIRVDGSHEQRLPFSIAHLEAADTIHEVIARNTDECIRIMGVAGPETSHQRLAADMNAGGLRAVMTPRDAHQAVADAASWMLRYLESVAYLADVGQIHDEVVDAVKKGRGLAGMHDARPRRARAACIVCGTNTVEVDWQEDGTAKVQCKTCHLPAPAFDPRLVFEVQVQAAFEEFGRAGEQAS